MSILKGTLDDLKEFLNGISPTVWGLLIILICIALKVRKTDSETVYYFAGIGSTLLGINHEKQGNVNNSVINSELK